MKVKALISFSGAVTMYAGEICEITDTQILSDLLKAEYIIPVEVTEQGAEEQQPEEQVQEEPKSPAPKKQPKK